MPDELRPVRRRRRAVGPAGASPGVRLEVPGTAAPDADQPSQESDDDRLRREVPPHHGD